MERLRRFHSIQQLDPIQDTWEICRQLVGYEFPWDITRALELALFRTFCVPSIALLLDRSAEFHHRPQKRYDDTGLMISLILKWGYDTPQGQQVIQRMNRIHGHFPIRNADFLYVLSTFIYEPIRWIERFGWRQLTSVEKQALFHFWYRVGQQMQIQEIPDSYGSFECYNLEYEERHFQYNSANQRVGESTFNLFLSWFPRPVQPLVHPFIYGIMDDRMIKAFGFPPPQPWKRHLLAQLLRSRGHLLRYLPPCNSPKYYSDEPQRSYPQGYHLKDIGPPGMLSELNSSQPNDP